MDDGARRQKYADYDFDPFMETEELEPLWHVYGDQPTVRFSAKRVLKAVGLTMLLIAILLAVSEYL